MAEISAAIQANRQAHALGSLIAGDKDLLKLCDRYPIVTPTDFWARHSRLSSAPNAKPPVYFITLKTRPNVAVGLPLLPGGAGEGGGRERGQIATNNIATHAHQTSANGLYTYKKVPLRSRSIAPVQRARRPCQLRHTAPVPLRQRVGRHQPGAAHAHHVGQGQ